MSNGAGNATMSASEFIRSMPTSWTTKQIYEEGQKQGVLFSPNLPSVVRSADRKNAREKAAAKKAIVRASPDARAVKRHAPGPKTAKLKPGEQDFERGQMKYALLKFIASYIQTHNTGPRLTAMRDEGGFSLGRSASGISSTLARFRDHGILAWDRGDYTTMRLGPHYPDGKPSDVAAPKDAPQLPPPKAAEVHPYENLIRDLRKAAQTILGKAALAGQDVAESAKTFGQVIDLLINETPQGGARQ